MSSNTLALTNTDQRTIAAAVCTPKEQEAWEAVDLHGMSLRAASLHLDISLSAVRGRLDNARRKISRYIQTEFPTKPAAPIPPCDPDEPLSMVIALLIQRDGPCCYLCNRVPTIDAYCVEHIIPRSRGGTNDATNLGLACNSCNGRKGANIVSLRTTSGRPVYHSHAG